MRLMGMGLTVELVNAHHGKDLFLVVFDDELKDAFARLDSSAAALNFSGIGISSNHPIAKLARCRLLFELDLAVEMGVPLEL